MNHSATALRQSYSPLRLESRSLGIRITTVAIGTIVLTLSSYITVPMYPVPVTMQTYAILLVAALYGWRMGTLTVLAWLGEAAVGMPVLAGGASGPAVFAGPTAGYIFSWPLITVVVGWLVERGWTATARFSRSSPWLRQRLLPRHGRGMACRLHRPRNGHHGRCPALHSG